MNKKNNRKRIEEMLYTLSEIEADIDLYSNKEDNGRCGRVRSNIIELGKMFI